MILRMQHYSISVYFIIFTGKCQHNRIKALVTSSISQHIKDLIKENVFFSGLLKITVTNHGDSCSSMLSDFVYSIF